MEIDYLWAVELKDYWELNHDCWTCLVGVF